MKEKFRADELLISRLKHLVADLFRLDLTDPERISENEPLIGGELGLDSLDALELAMCIEEEFGLALPGRAEMHTAFGSIASLARSINARGRKTAPHAGVIRLPRAPAGAEMAG